MLLVEAEPAPATPKQRPLRRMTPEMVQQIEAERLRRSLGLRPRQIAIAVAAAC